MPCKLPKGQKTLANTTEEDLQKVAHMDPATVMRLIYD